MRQFNIGQVVTCIPDRFLRHAAPGDYKIIAAMPDRDGDHMYRIKSPLEEHERVVRESLLVKSQGSSVRVGQFLWPGRTAGVGGLRPMSRVL